MALIFHRSGGVLLLVFFLRTRSDYWQFYSSFLLSRGLSTFKTKMLCQLLTFFSLYFFLLRRNLKLSCYFSMCPNKMTLYQMSKNQFSTWEEITLGYILCTVWHTIRKVKFVSKNSILTIPQHFHEFFTHKNRQFSREIKVEFLDKKWRFRTVWRRNNRFLLTTTRFLNSSGLEKTTHLSIVYGSSIHYFRLDTLLENSNMRFVLLFLKNFPLVNVTKK